ncbi:dihydroxyacetone kinase transcriptional activator DhaS [Lactococcus cremoris]|nr:dihydroxyacetone kinase transcriptional activator DhaS [Lactococcus cremoris]
MQSNAYHQISVSDIMQVAKIRRQTFYNYFQNQEELLSWIFENDFAELINDNLDYYGWQKELLLLLRYLDENQIFYQKIFFLFNGKICLIRCFLTKKISLTIIGQT